MQSNPDTAGQKGQEPHPGTAGDAAAPVRRRLRRSGIALSVLCAAALAAAGVGIGLAVSPAGLAVAAGNIRAAETPDISRDSTASVSPAADARTGDSKEPVPSQPQQRAEAAVTTDTKAPADDNTGADGDAAAGKPDASASGDTPVLEDAVPQKTLILIGDSRTVGIYWALTGDESLHTVQTDLAVPATDAGDLGTATDTVFSCREGIGLAWMEESGVPYAEDRIGEDTAVIILMGVNDLAGDITPGDYLSYLNEKAAAWTAAGAEVSYVSVNPVEEEVSGITNEKIDAWNSAIRDGLSSAVSYIDTNAQISGHIDFKDHLHYRTDTNLEIYRIIRDTVEGTGKG